MRKLIKRGLVRWKVFAVILGLNFRVLPEAVGVRRHVLEPHLWINVPVTAC